MDRRKKGEYIGALGALLVHVAVIALLILVSFTVPQPDEDAGGVPVMMGNVDAASGFDDPSLVDVDIMDEDAAAPAETAPELPFFPVYDPFYVLPPVVPLLHTLFLPVTVLRSIRPLH